MYPGSYTSGSNDGGWFAGGAIVYIHNDGCISCDCLPGGSLSATDSTPDDVFVVIVRSHHLGAGNFHIMVFSDINEAQ